MLFGRFTSGFTYIAEEVAEEYIATKFILSRYEWYEDPMFIRKHQKEEELRKYNLIRERFKAFYHCTDFQFK